MISDVNRLATGTLCKQQAIRNQSKGSGLALCLADEMHGSTAPHIYLGEQS